MDVWQCFLDGVTDFSSRYWFDLDETCGVWDIVTKFPALQAQGFKMSTDSLYMECLDKQNFGIFATLPSGVPVSLLVVNSVVTAFWVLPLLMFLCSIRASCASTLSHFSGGVCTGCVSFWSVCVGSHTMDEPQFKKVVDFLQKAGVNEFGKMSSELQTAILEQLKTNPECKLGIHWEFVESKGPDETELYRREFFDVALRLKLADMKLPPDGVRHIKIDVDQDALESQLDKLLPIDKACFLHVKPYVNYVSHPPSLTCAARLDRIHKAVADAHFRGIMKCKPTLRRELKKICSYKAL